MTKSGEKSERGKEGDALLMREASRLARRLVVSGWHILRVGGGFFLANKDRRRGEITADLIAFMRRHDWLEEIEDGGGLVLSLAGRRWVRRQAKLGERAFQAQHQELVQEGGGKLINLHEDPLLWLKRRRGRDGKPLIEEIHYQAGTHLRRDFMEASRTPSMVANWERPVSRESGGGRGVEGVEHALEARKRFEAAVAALGEDLADIVVEVCCHAAGLEEAERRLNWPRHSARVVLRIALTRLAKHYGLLR